jgi:hypothetical protein
MNLYQEGQTVESHGSGDEILGDSKAAALVGSSRFAMWV